MRAVAVAGNPNSGKTSIFNLLTGSNQQVGNWPGVTVERKEGVARLPGEEVRAVDLPGVYSLSAVAEDEKAARDFLLEGRYDLILNVVDATNLERNLYLTAQLLELGLPMVVALNVSDSARAQGIRIDVPRLGVLLGRAPIVETVGHRGRGLDELIEAAIGLVGTDGALLRVVA